LRQLVANWSFVGHQLCGLNVEIVRVGTNEPVKVNVRLISADEP